MSRETGLHPIKKEEKRRRKGRKIYVA